MQNTNFDRTGQGSKFEFSKLIRDCHYAFRALVKKPGFSTAAVLVLGLSIGANFAVFSLVDSLFLRPLPVDDPENLILISSMDPQGHSRDMFSKVLENLREESVFRGVCGFATPRLTTEVDGSVQSTGTLAMTADCFQTLGIRTQIGQPFTLNEDRINTEKVAVLTDSAWHSMFGAKLDVLGKKVKVQGLSFTVIGITEPRFTSLVLGFPPGLIIPLEQTPTQVTAPPNSPIYFWVKILARRTPGVSMDQVRARMGAIEKQLFETSTPRRYNPQQRRDYLARKVVISSATSEIDSWLRDRFGKPLYVILGICGAVLIIACVNLIVLLLALELSRQQEVAIRFSLGATRMSIIRLRLLEHSLIILGGTGTGILLGYWIDNLLISNTAHLFPGFAVNISPDLRMALFGLGIAVILFLLFALVPLWRYGFMRESAVPMSHRRVIGSKARNQKLLLGVQLACTLALVAGSAGFASSLKHLDEMDLGMNITGVSEAALLPRSGSYGTQPLDAYYRDLLQRLQQLPDVSAAAISDFGPLWTTMYPDTVTTLENQARTDIQAEAISVSNDFFRTLSIPILEGTDFLPGSDNELNEPTAVVSQSLANMLGSGEVIGRHIGIGDTSSYQRLRIVGIVADAQISLENPQEHKPAIVYTNMWQHPDRQKYTILLTRTQSGNPLSAATLQKTVMSFGQEYVDLYTSLSDARDDALIENRLLAYLSIAFSILALLLASTGLYGLLSYQVTSRTNEIGIRMALGAKKTEIGLVVLRQLSPVMIIALVAGIGLTLVASRMFAGLVFGVKILNPWLLSLSVAVLTLAAVIAAWNPTRRACSIDPLAALRQE